MTDTLTAVDLFCGAGGFSAGLAETAERLDRDVELHAINHWEPAIATHEANHPWANQYHAKVEELHPPDVVEGTVDILVGGPECTHFSTARGGQPVSEQERASPWHIVDWLEKLEVDSFAIENVPELESWGPVEDGEPTRNGEVFDAWINALHSLGYSVDWTTLTAADYGDPTSRTRFFVVGRRDGRATFPSPTHSDVDDDHPPHRTAAEILDWSDPGYSVWGRDRPLVENTMQRIGEGLRRHGTDAVAEYADVVASLGQDDVESLQATAVDPSDVPAHAADADEPFLVDIGDDSESFALASAFLLGQHSNAVARSVDDPVPTVATKGAISLTRPSTFILPRNGVRGGLHSNATYTPDDRPFHTVTASNHDGHVVDPYLVEYYGNGTSQSVDAPLPTVTTKDRFALVVPELYPLGLELRFRMLKPTELKQAQGFPADYELVGTKTERTAQIGNAVPVGLAQSLIEHLLLDDSPSLASYGNEAVATDGGGES